MTIAAYARYSSDQQRDASIDDQLRNIHAWCQRSGMAMPTAYTDAAISGSRQDRPGYQSMLQAAERGEITVILVDDLTRLSRDQIELTRTVRLLRHWGVRLVGVTDGVDTDRKGHKLEVGLRGLMGELYLDDLAEKTHRGLMGQALQGFSAGGLAYGYRAVHTEQGNGREIDQDQAQWVQHIYRMYAAGHSPRDIADDLNQRGIPSPRGSTWAVSAIYGDIKRGIGVLANPIYIGRQTWNRSKWEKDPTTGRRRRIERPQSEWVTTEHPELRIVPQELWDAAQARSQSARSKTRAAQQKTGSTRARNGRGPKYLFSGLLTCGTCGGAYVIIDRHRYGCSTHKDRGASVCSNANKVPRATVEKHLLEGIKRDLMSEAAYTRFEGEVRAAMKSQQPDASDIKRQIAKAEKERDNIMSAIMAGIITPSTKAALETAEGTIADMQRQAAAVARVEPAKILPRARDIYRTMVSQLENIDDIPAARTAIQQLTGKITLVPEQIEGREILVAEMNTGGLLAACKINMVAGAGYENYFTPLRIPLTAQDGADNTD